MGYNNPAPAQSTTLADEERAREATRIVNMLREENEDDLVRKLTSNALGFVQEKMLEASLGGQVKVTPNQLLFLRDIWAKFA